MGCEDIFVRLREKNYIIYINTAYKQKVDKIKSINLRKITGNLYEICRDHFH